MTRYWIGVASREHVLNGVSLGIAQLCHGKPGPLKRMSLDDWIIYYSPTNVFGQKIPYRKFTAIGRIIDDEPYQYKMSTDFTPWRRKVKFEKVSEVAIEPLLADLTFIKNKRYWGLIFRSGSFEISFDDFYFIATRMGVRLYD